MKVDTAILSACGGDSGHTYTILLCNGNGVEGYCGNSDHVYSCDCKGIDVYSGNGSDGFSGKGGDDDSVHTGDNNSQYGRIGLGDNSGYGYSSN